MPKTKSKPNVPQGFQEAQIQRTQISEPEGPAPCDVAPSADEIDDLPPPRSPADYAAIDARSTAQARRDFAALPDPNRPDPDLGDVVAFVHNQTPAIVAHNRAHLAAAMGALADSGIADAARRDPLSAIPATPQTIAHAVGAALAASLAPRR